jgi:hypothetical protein
VLLYTVPFNEDSPLGQRIFDIANLSLFIVGRFILTTLFGMQIEGPSVTYYLAALAVTWLFYSALLAPPIFFVVLVSHVKASQPPEPEYAISPRAKWRIAFVLLASNLGSIFLWKLASATPQGSAPHWTRFLITLGFVDCTALAIGFVLRRHLGRR